MCLAIVQPAARFFFCTFCACATRRSGGLNMSLTWKQLVSLRIQMRVDHAMQRETLDLQRVALVSDVTGYPIDQVQVCVDRVIVMSFHS